MWRREGGNGKERNRVLSLGFKKEMSFVSIDC